MNKIFALLCLIITGHTCSPGGYYHDDYEYVFENSWYMFNDADEGGLSTWSCNGVEGSMLSGVEECLKDGVLEVDLNLIDGVPYYETDSSEVIAGYIGYAGVALKTQVVVNGVKQGLDLNDFRDGIYIDYESDRTMYLYLVLESNTDELEAPRVMLYSNSTKKHIQLDDFRQEGWEKDENLTDLQSGFIKEIRILPQVGYEFQTNFKLKSLKVGQNMCADEWEHPVKSIDVKNEVPLHYTFNDGALNFNAVSNHFLVDVFNQKGAKLLSKEISPLESSLNLKTLEIGSYVVRTPNGILKFLKD